MVRCHTDLRPGRNVYLTSWFILSVLVERHFDSWFILSEMCHIDLHPGRNVYLTS